MIPENMLMAKQMLVKLRLSKLEIVLMHYTGQGVLEKILSSVNYRQAGKSMLPYEFFEDALYCFFRTSDTILPMNSKRTWSVIISTLNKCIYRFQ